MSTIDDIAATALQLTEAMRATAADPVDAIRLLSAFIATPLPQPAGPDEAAAQAATSALFRRAAMTSMAMACTAYQPTSSTEATAMINRVAALLDVEVLTAADAGQTATYAALRDLRAAVVADLTARSATLPELVTVRFRGNLPSLVLAYRLYGDSTREPGMVARASVVHPGFMPASFEALAQ